MRIFLLLALFSTIIHTVQAQRECSSFDYQQQLLSDSDLRNRAVEIENFVQRKLNANRLAGKPHAGVVFKIPVVVHILYNKNEENISDERVFSQIAVLNRSFRRLHADTTNTPDAFKAIAADSGI